MAKKFGLGRGLGSLIPTEQESDTAPNLSDSSSDEVAPVENSSPERQNIKYIHPSKISTSHYQPRQLFEHTALEELVSSIKEYGVLEPLIVSPLPDGNYQLVAGERRLRAVKILDLPTVPVIVRTVSEQQRLEISLIENVQRRDLTPMEEARAYKKLIEEFTLTQEELSKKVGKSRSKIANSLRLLTLPPQIQELVSTGKLSEGHAKVILQLDDREQQLKAAENIIGKNLSVRQTEKAVHKIQGKVKKIPILPDNILAWQQALSNFLQTKIKIKRRGKKGTIEIDYYGEEELENIVNKITDKE